MSERNIQGTIDAIQSDIHKLDAKLEPRVLHGLHWTSQDNTVTVSKMTIRLQDNNLQQTDVLEITSPDLELNTANGKISIEAPKYNALVPPEDDPDGLYVESDGEAFKVESSPYLVYVDGSASKTGYGSSLSPFKTIAEAINKAKPNSIIIIRPGTYSENPVLNKSNITLLGYSIDKNKRTIIDGTLTISAEYTVVERLTANEISVANGGNYVYLSYASTIGNLVIHQSGNVDAHNCYIGNNININNTLVNPVWLDQCHVENTLTIENGSVITGNCDKLHVVGYQGYHFEIGTSRFTGSPYSCDYDAAFTMVGIMGGVSADISNPTAALPIRVNGIATQFYLGTLQFNEATSILNGVRLDYGLTSFQLLDKIERAGYPKPVSNFLKDHLDSISAKFITADAALAKEIADRTKAVSDEATARETADNALQSNLNTEIVNRQEAINTVTGALSQESQDRIVAIGDEKTEREDADIALGVRITGEANRASMAEEALGAKILKEEGDRKADVQAEANARTLADSGLSGKIDAEAARAGGVEGQLRADLTGESSNREQADNAEASNRASADTALGGRIDTEIIDRGIAVADLNTRKTEKLVNTGNGNTWIRNTTSAVGAELGSNQNDIGTSFNVFADNVSGNPVLGGLVGRQQATGVQTIDTQLLVGWTGSKANIYLIKDGANPTTSTELIDDNLLLNKGEIDTQVNYLLSLISQGLKNPTSIDKESNLPSFASASNGDYFVISEMDQTAPNHTGRAWKNTNSDPNDWQKVVDSVYAPDGLWTTLNDKGEMTLTNEVQTKITSSARTEDMAVIGPGEITSPSVDVDIIETLSNRTTYRKNFYKEVIDTGTCTPLKVELEGLIMSWEKKVKTTPTGDLSLWFYAKDTNNPPTISYYRRSLYSSSGNEGSNATSWVITYQEDVHDTTSSGNGVDTTIYWESQDMGTMNILINNKVYEIIYWSASTDWFLVFVERKY